MPVLTDLFLLSFLSLVDTINALPSCLALSDLLSGRQVDDVVEYIPSLWELCFKARDDIKESVRQAADAACRTLSKVNVHVMAFAVSVDVM